MHYAGIGSRRTPEEALVLCQQIAERLDELGWTLRSGHAPGADQAFERGAGSRAEVYLPWDGFERSVPIMADTIYGRPSKEAIDMAARFHPYWDEMRSTQARAMHARNSHQVLGRSLSSKSTFILCWTADGATTDTTAATGGTGQALRIARAYEIPVFNLNVEEHRERVENMLASEVAGQPD